jgi:hypothetical protein
MIRFYKIKISYIYDANKQYILTKQLNAACNMLFETLMSVFSQPNINTLKITDNSIIFLPTKTTNFVVLTSGMAYKKRGKEEFTVQAKKLTYVVSFTVITTDVNFDWSSFDTGLFNTMRQFNLVGVSLHSVEIKYTC